MHSFLQFGGVISLAIESLVCVCVLGLLKPFFPKTGNRLLKLVIVCLNHSPNNLFCIYIYIYIYIYTCISVFL